MFKEGGSEDEGSFSVDVSAEERAEAEEVMCRPCGKMICNHELVKKMSTKLNTIIKSVAETGEKFKGKDIRKEYLERTGHLKRGSAVARKLSKRLSKAN